MAEPHLKTGGEQKFLRPADAHHSASLAPADECSVAFKDIKLKRKHRYVLFKIEGDKIVVDRAGERQSDPQAFISSLPSADCRYAVYDHEAKSADGRLVSKLYFITWLPNTAARPLVMAYTHAKPTIKAICDGVFDINANTTKDIQSGMGVAGSGADSSDEEEFDPDA